MIPHYETKFVAFVHERERFKAMVQVESVKGKMTEFKVAEVVDDNGMVMGKTPELIEAIGRAIKWPRER